MNRIESFRTKDEKRSEVNRVYDRIKGLILKGEVRPGEFLGELGLAQLCKTSRTPVREACSRLSQENWLSRIRRKGYLVPAISVREIIEVYEFRKLIECFTVEKAAGLASAEELAQLRAMTEVERHPPVVAKDAHAANEAFHLGIAQIARNQRVLSQLKGMLQYVHRLDILSVERDSGSIPHNEILRALEARKPAEAKKAMASHIDYARERILKIFATS